MTIREKIIDIASKEIGYAETGNNLTKYSEWFGYGYDGKPVNGKPWCAIFVSWVYAMAGFTWIVFIETQKGWVWVPTMYYRAKQNNWITLDPQSGDIVLFDWNGDKSADHTGIFLRWIDHGKTFESIEGNTSIANQSNGGAVMLRTRNFSSVQCFVKVLP